MEKLKNQIEDMRKFRKCYDDEMHKISVCFDYISSKILDKFYSLKSLIICIIKIETYAKNG